VQLDEWRSSKEGMLFSAIFGCQNDWQLDAIQVLSETTNGGDNNGRLADRHFVVSRHETMHGMLFGATFGKFSA
jgi:hypothetical protein